MDTGTQTNLESSNRFVSKVCGLIAQLLVVLAFISAHASCTKERLGSLVINSSIPGEYALFRVLESKASQLVAEQKGQYGKKLELSAGIYIIIADCSSTMIQIRPNKTSTLAVRTVSFTPPNALPQPSDPSHPEASVDSFHVQCTSNQQFGYTQQFNERFQFSFLPGDWELLVGMVPLKLKIPSSQDLKSEPSAHDSPLQFQLGALRVNSTRPSTHRLFFVSPKDQLISATKSQTFGNSILLLPGTYTVEVYGTSKDVEIASGQLANINCGYVKFIPPKEISLERAVKVTGNPQLIEINEGHWLEFGPEFPILPAMLTFRIGRSSRQHEVLIEPDKVTEIKLDAVEVDFQCKEDNWACLGKKTVSIFSGDAFYPFLEGPSDAPLLFLRKAEESIWISIEGSRDIKRLVRNNKRSHVYDVGLITVQPQPTFKEGTVTDLIRIEPANKEYTSGASLDLSTTDDSEISLIAGTYLIAQYYSFSEAKGERQRKARWLHIKKSEPQTYTLKTYLSKSKFQKWQESETQKEKTHTTARKTQK